MYKDKIKALKEEILKLNNSIKNGSNSYDINNYGVYMIIQEKEKNLKELEKLQYLSENATLENSEKLYNETKKGLNLDDGIQNVYKMDKLGFMDGIMVLNKQNRGEVAKEILSTEKSFDSEYRSYKNKIEMLTLDYKIRSREYKEVEPFIKERKETKTNILKLESEIKSVSREINKSNNQSLINSLKIKLDDLTNQKDISIRKSLELSNKIDGLNKNFLNPQLLSNEIEILNKELFKKTNHYSETIKSLKHKERVYSEELINYEKLGELNIKERELEKNQSYTKEYISLLKEKNALIDKITLLNNYKIEVEINRVNINMNQMKEKIKTLEEELKTEIKERKEMGSDINKTIKLNSLIDKVVNNDKSLSPNDYKEYTDLVKDETLSLNKRIVENEDKLEITKKELVKNIFDKNMERRGITPNYYKECQRKMETLNKNQKDRVVLMVNTESIVNNELAIFDSHTSDDLKIMLYKYNEALLNYKSISSMIENNGNVDTDYINKVEVKSFDEEMKRMDVNDKNTVKRRASSKALNEIRKILIDISLTNPDTNMKYDEKDIKNDMYLSPALNFSYK